MNSYLSNQNKPLKRRFFADLKIGYKLGVGFGVLVALIFFSAVASFTSSATAIDQIQTTDKVRVPTALLASQAQADLLRMLADVRGYLAFGDPEYQRQYELHARAFSADLSNLDLKYAPDLGKNGYARLAEAKGAFEDWQPLPERLFELHDDKLDREPAYKMLATDGVTYAGQVIIDINTMIAEQGSREPPTLENLSLMGDMARFQGNFAAMLSALRGYVTTQNRIYRGEYEVNLADNQNSWERLLRQREQMTPKQQSLLDSISKNRAAFLEMPDKIFELLEGEHSREDLYLFRTEALPLTDTMSESLNQLVLDQQTSLQSGLSSGSQALQRANQLINGIGVLALVVGVIMAYAAVRTIALPISRLTEVAEQIRGGDLEAQAAVESGDEIGILAATFNNMTAKLRDTLFQVRKEKKRADDLLGVVIPIGVELSTEKDFNRLLEKMLMEAKTFCRADTGVLYMITPKDELEFVIARSDSLNLALGGTTGKKLEYASLPMKVDGKPNQSNLISRVALNGDTVNVAEFTRSAQSDLWGEDPRNQFWRDYAVTSLLAIPLKNSDERVLGVLQLINAHDAETSRVISFDLNLQQMMESFSSLAVAALEAFAREQKLKQEINQLRIEIDEVKRQKQVSEIVDSDFFRDLTSRAKDMRNRAKKSD